jgi:hypothetical protein
MIDSVIYDIAKSYLTDRVGIIRAERRRRARARADDVAFSVICDIAKSHPTGRYVAGWASVTHQDGKQVVDLQNDIIDVEELRKAAHDYILNARVAKVNHNGAQIGSVVESVIIDEDFAKAHGIAHKNRGWWIGMAIDDPATREKVRKGALKAFSIGGAGKRVETQIDA